jgi:hypothetical protein
MPSQYNPVMRVWGWFAASAVWLTLVAFSSFNFAVAVTVDKYIPRRFALGLASSLMYLILSEPNSN